MADHASRWLIEQIRHNTHANSLWFADENNLQDFHTLKLLANKPRIVSNRWDLVQHASAEGFDAEFSDFDLRHLADHSLARIFYRVSKEKPLTHYLLNQAARLLQPKGELLLCGEKSQGIKTYIDKAARLFGCDVRARKDGFCYSANLALEQMDNQAPLDDQDYTQLRLVSPEEGFSFFSKPGVFGWNKIDLGSALLVDQLQQHLPSPSLDSLLDLGCGYGYLTLMTKELMVNRRFATDNNATALLAAEKNFSMLGLDVDVIAADAGDRVEQKVDLLLCNPPFHQGFDMDGDLTDKFLAAGKRLLKPTGQAFFVVNQFIPLERKAAALFLQVELLCQHQGFKVFRLRP